MSVGSPDVFIFLAVVVAWAVYLIPKALSHHEEAVRSRSIDRFSDTMRVLARREPVNSRNARLVLQPGRAATSTQVSTKGPGLSPAQQRARREAARRATKRRRNVLLVLLLATLTVAGFAAANLISWGYLAIPAVLVVAWLVTCRVMVKGERTVAAPARVEAPAEEPAETVDPRHPESFEVSRNDDGFDEVAPSATTAVTAADPRLWDPLPMTLPTYVDAPAARRTVRTIDLDSTGVWSSGRSEVDSALAREAEESERAARDAAADRGRATGS